MSARAGSSQPSATPIVPGRYAEYASSGALRPFVECFWTREAGAPLGDARVPRVHRVLPDGCIDLLVEFPSANASGPASAMAVGTMTRALVLDAEDAGSFIGVRFRPGKATAFLHLPACELTDLHVSLGDVWSDASAVHDALAAAPDVPARMRVLERLLIERLADGGTGDQRDVDEAVRRIQAAGGSLGITRLAPSLGVTRQHLARRFARLVGVPPKVFARVVRLRRVIERVRAAESERALNWTALALEAGYYDQAHLVDEFRELAGVTPSAWARSSGIGSDLVIPFFQDRGHSCG